MTNVVEKYKNMMQMAPDQHLPGNEWELVDELLAHPPDEFDAILRWIFEEHKGYIEPRARAGLEFMKRNPVEGLAVVERLISSNDPDDRDTAITVLERQALPSVFHLAKPLLEDPYPYLRFEAAELLRDIYPDQVKATLEELAKHPTEEWIRESAQGRLREMGESVTSYSM